MKLTASARILNQQWRYDPDTGWLRCTASILKPGVMIYRRHEVEDANPPDSVGDTARLYVPPEELQDQDSISTLEGVPACVGHIWQTAGNITSCGSVAGAPRIDGDHLLADILVTDPDAVRRIMLPDTDHEKLQEISSAGDWSIIWEPGVSPDGEAYDGKFVKIRYNHVALLPAGAGRAGASVRIINTKEAMQMEFTRVKVKGGKTIRVLNEDVEKLEEAMNEAESEVKNAISPEQLQEALDELSALKEEVSGKNERISELEGMIQSYKDQLEAALSEEAIEEAAVEMAEEREEAAAVMNAAGLAAEDLRKLRGHALRTKVVNSIRVRNGKPELTETELKDESFVKGLYRGQVEMSGATRVTGASVVAINNSHNSAPSMSNNQARFARMYTKKEG